MAIIKTGMKRPDLNNLFEDIDLSICEQKVSSATELINKLHINEFPINLSFILQKFNICYEEKCFEDSDLSGMLIKNDNIYTIIVNKDHSQNRKNFTIAHELGHYFLHRDLQDRFEDQVFFRGATADNFELQANIFAGELLMPEKEFKNKIISGINTIPDLAEYFSVSTLALRVRAKQLNLTGHGL